MVRMVSGGVLNFDDFATFDYWDNFDIVGPFGNKFKNELYDNNVDYDPVKEEIPDQESIFTYYDDNFPFLSSDDEKDRPQKKPTSKPTKKVSPAPDKENKISRKKKKEKKKHRSRIRKKFKRKDDVGIMSRMKAGFKRMMEVFTRPGRNIRNGVHDLMRTLRR